MREIEPPASGRDKPKRSALPGLGLFSANIALAVVILWSYIAPPAPTGHVPGATPTPFATVVIGAQPTDIPTSAPTVAASPTATTHPRPASPTATARPATAAPTATAPAATVTPNSTIQPGA